MTLLARKELLSNKKPTKEAWQSLCFVLRMTRHKWQDKSVIAACFWALGPCFSKVHPYLGRGWARAHLQALHLQVLHEGLPTWMIHSSTQCFDVFSSCFPQQQRLGVAVAVCHETDLARPELVGFPQVPMVPIITKVSKVFSKPSYLKLLTLILTSGSWDVWLPSTV